MTLPVNGTYSILVDPDAQNTGSVTVRLQGVPADSTGTIAADGQPVPVRLDVPGQNGVLIFPGVAGQRVTMALSENTIPAVSVRVRQPDGTQLGSTFLSGSSGFLDVMTLPVNGTYSILVDPDAQNTGSVTVRLQGVPADNTGTIAAVRQPQRERLLENFTPTEPTQWIPPTQSKTPDSGKEAPAEGATGLAGRVLQLDGSPLANVTLEVEGRAATTDNTGGFLLVDVPAGHRVLVIRGDTAGPPERRYGRFEVGVDIGDTRINQLPFTIWMPELDTANEVTIPVPTSEEVVLRTPAIPGLEVHLPPGTVVRDDHGQPVERLGITAIPIDRPPFPLPLLGVQVPVYFTVQPGGYVHPEGARIIYPNYTKATPNRRVEFYNYDPNERGWYVYGHGKVSADGMQVIPDPGVAVWEFAGAMFNAGNLPPDIAPPPEGNASDGDPVDCATGLLVDSETDLSLPDDSIPLSITRTYRSNDTDSRPFGIGATFPYEMFLWSAKQWEQVDLVLPDGARVHYVRSSPGTNFTDAAFASTPTPTRFRDSTITRNNSRSGWDLRLRDGANLFFPQFSPLTEIRDRFGNQLTITRNNIKQITRITTPGGRWVTLDYDPANRITQITDNTGRTVAYAYDEAGRLARVTDPGGRVRTYTYDAAHRRVTRTDPRGNADGTNAYDEKGRVAQQTLADGSSWQFAYTTDAAGRITTTSVTDPRGTINAFTFNDAGYALTYTQAVGTAQQRTTSYTRGPDQKITAIRDPLGRTTQTDYDDRGNPTTVVQLEGTAQALTWSMTYDPTFNQLTGYTDPLGHSRALEYDSRGAVTSLTDPLGNRTGITTDQHGRPTKITDLLGRSWAVGYLLGDLTTITDPLGRTTRVFLDSAGRRLGLADELGNVSRFVFDAVDQLVTSTNPIGESTSYTYDPGGNLLTRTDARGGVISYAYDNRDRTISRIDPLNRAELYSYDPGGKLTGYTDRRGSHVTFDYDPLGRRTSIVYASSRTDAYSYDAANRLITASSTPAATAGTISRTYDDLDRLTSERTEQGKIDYGYDNGNRRTSMTIAGQPAVSYTYDDANRLTNISRQTVTVSIGWDAAGRRTSVKLSNGVTTGYNYDQGDRLTAITYSQDSGALGALSYDYDQTGLRERMDGSFSTVDLPAAMPTASYDAANQLTHWATTTLTHDANGNLTNDGTQSYTWGARNELAQIDGSVTATFNYDPLGRRTQKTVGSTDTRYLYDDRGNPVQELTGTTPNATMLTGLILDEFYGRLDGSGANVNYFLTDALGNTVALANDTGITTRYGYQPFGTVTISGPASSNPYQFTGRENDGTGLDNYRARYYSPTLHRFISEDPIRTDDGISFYSYAADNPVNLTDPTGLTPGWVNSLRGLAKAIALAYYTWNNNGKTPEQTRQHTQDTVQAPAPAEGEQKGGTPQGTQDPSNSMNDFLTDAVAAGIISAAVADILVAYGPILIIVAL
jgi:RHS repeat-associated protein